jgi:hypothetical protein
VMLLMMSAILSNQILMYKKQLAKLWKISADCEDGVRSLQAETIQVGKVELDGFPFI